MFRMVFVPFLVVFDRSVVPMVASERLHLEGVPSAAQALTEMLSPPRRCRGRCSWLSCRLR
jgi:hypothetical protein